MTSMGLSQYETSSNAVLRELGIEFVDIDDFNCCGYPLKNLNFRAYLLSSARNLALAEKAGLDILTVCNCCYGSLKHAQHVLNGISLNQRRDKREACSAGIDVFGNGVDKTPAERSS